MKPAGVILATIALAASVVAGATTMGLAHGGGGGGGGFGGGGHGSFGGGHGSFGGGHSDGIPFMMHGGGFGGFGGSHMSHGNHFGGYSHHYFHHGNGYRSDFPYFPSYDDDDDPGYYDYNRPYCSRANPTYNPYTGAYIGRDGRLHYCS